jgi:hypothetical protein
MNYKPNPKEWELWDTWMFSEPDGQRMHLFYLCGLTRNCWEWIGHAVSSDLVHWQELPTIRVCRPDDSYDSKYIGTGMVFATPDGEYMMSYTANFDAEKSKISFLHSKDLMEWEKRWQEPCIEAQPKYYESDPAKSLTVYSAFRDAYIHKVGDHYEALICADAVNCDSILGAVVARYRSVSDNLQKWEALPPLFGPGVAALMEVPEHFEMNGKHYVIWTNVSGTGILCETPSRRRTGGTYYAIGDAYEGPYSCPEENLLIGSGDSSPCQGHVGRSILWKNERLFYHLLASPKAAAGFPKRVLQQSDGTLKLGYWPGIEKIHVRQWSPPLNRIKEICNLQVGQWRQVGKCGLEGSVEIGGSLVLVDEQAPSDFHLRCQITTDSAARWGVTLCDNSEPLGKNKEMALQADFLHGEWHFGEPVHNWISRIDPVEIIHEAPCLGRAYQIDLLIRDVYFEAYVDSIWRFTRGITDRAKQGRIGFFVDSGSVLFNDIQCWELEPMLHPNVNAE